MIGLFSGLVKLLGGTDGTTIGNVGDRLKVDSLSSSGAPYKRVIYQFARPEDGSGDHNMGVNGASVNVNFDYAPTGSEIVYVESIEFQILDPGTSNYDNFGGIAALTNGVQLIIKLNGTEYTLYNLQRNEEIAMLFSRNPLIPPTSGFFEQSDAYMGTMDFDVPIQLNASTGDFIRFKIRDNLTGIQHMDALVKYWKEI
jgi:hypothetical protein